jgi:predicted small secreted protein
MRRIVIWGVLGVMIGGLAGCATMRGMVGRDAKSDSAALATEPAAAASTEMDHETRLREKVNAEIAATNTTPQFVRRKPYYYQEYMDYSGGASSYEVSLTEKDSRTVPFMAEVKLPKVRYATKLHRNRGDAREDTNFFRETGTETRTYELRYGDWMFVGSMFQVDTTEEQVNGEWVPAQEEVVKAVSEESGQGWLGRTWSWVTGR